MLTKKSTGSLIKDLISGKLLYENEECTSLKCEPLAVKLHMRESAQTVSGIACPCSLAPSSEIKKERKEL